MSLEQKGNNVTAKRDDVRAEARRSLYKLFEPLAGFAVDTGLSVGEVQKIFRQAVVWVLADRQLEVGGRTNISGIAAATGLSRAEISKILRSALKRTESTNENQSQATNRILAIWYSDPKYTDRNGAPAELDIFGHRASFDALTREYGRGIPTRAVLEELLRAGAVELCGSQKVRAKSNIAVDLGVSNRAVRSFGDRGADLLATMLQNMRDPGNPGFVGTASESTDDPAALRIIRRELRNKSAQFLAEIQEGLIQKPDRRKAGAAQKGRLRNVSVTIFCNESKPKVRSTGQSGKKRHNFHRE